MKKQALSILLILISIQVYSQDVLTKKTGDDLEVKVLEVSLTEIKYKLFNNLDGPIFIILRSDVLMIQYENGTRSIFSDEQLYQTSMTIKGDLYVMGQRDASTYYKGYKPAGTGTFFSTLLLSPIIGLVPAIITSSTEPKEENLNFPNDELMSQSEYNRGYTEKSKKIKSGKVWKNWGIGFGVSLAAAIILTESGVINFL